MVTRTLMQVKVFDIKACGQTLSGHGYFDKIPGIIWNNGEIWESEEECTRLLNVAITDWEDRRNKNPWGTTDHKPELVIYWKTVKVIEE